MLDSMVHHPDLAWSMHASKRNHGTFGAPIAFKRAMRLSTNLGDHMVLNPTTRAEVSATPTPEENITIKLAKAVIPMVDILTRIML